MTRLILFENKLYYNLCYNKNNTFRNIKRNFSCSSLNQASDIKHSGSSSSVCDFYDDKSVFVTGGTGFLGKVLVEKLLYETNIDKLFLLIREKNGQSIHGRIDQMLNSPLFDRLKESKPTALDKIVPIVGDVVVPDLGIKTQDVKTLCEEASVVIHMAASVMFDEPFKVSLQFNYEGTKRIMKLAHQMQNIKSFVHVSSTYAYGFKGGNTIKEVVYPPPSNYKELDNFVAKYNDDKVETMKFLQKRVNTYTYCKALAENYIADNHGNIPTCIVRPAMITPKKDEPHAGWVDNWFGPTRVFYNAATGWNRSCCGRKEYFADLMPVDYVANFCIIAAAKNESKDVPVFNSCSSGANPVEWGFIMKCFIEDNVKNKFNNIPYPFIIFTESKLLANFYTWLFQLIPARIADSWLFVTGRTPKYTQTQKKVIRLREALSVFSENDWVIECDNARSLYRSLSESDQKRFPCDPVNIDWRKYLHDYWNGIQKYLSQTQMGAKRSETKK